MFNLLVFTLNSISQSASPIVLSPVQFTKVISSEVAAVGSSFFSNYDDKGKLSTGVQIGNICLLNGYMNPIDAAGNEINAYRNEKGLLKRDHLGAPLFLSDNEVKSLAISVKKMGFSFVRTDLTWSTADYLTSENRDFKTSNYDLEGYKKFAKIMTQQGLGVLFILRGANNKYRVSDYDAKNFEPTSGAKYYDMVSDLQIKQFANFARATANALSGCDVAFEIGNEPNSKMFFDNGMPDKGIDDPVSGAGFARIVQAAQGAIKSANPKIPVISGGTFTTPPNFLREILKKKDAQAESGSWFSLDGLGIHPYSRVEPESQLGFFDKTGRTMYDPFGYTRDLAKSDPSTKDLNVPPLAVTETGYSSTLFKADGEGDKSNANFDGTTEIARHRQAVFTVRNLLCNWIKAAPLVSIYEFEDRPYIQNGKWIFSATEEQSHYGLVNYVAGQDWKSGRGKPHGQGADKRSGAAIRFLLGFVKDSSKVRTLHQMEESRLDLYAVSFGEKKFAVWQRSASASQECKPQVKPVEIFVPGVTSAVDMYGKSRPFVVKKHAGALGVSVSLSENDGPVYLR
jgi:hypothetical protein